MAQSDRPKAKRPPIPRLDITAGEAVPYSPPDAGVVVDTDKHRVITSHDGRFQVKAARIDKFQATLELVDISAGPGGMYTYMLHNSPLSKQAINGVIFEGGDFEGFKVFAAGWTATPFGIVNAPHDKHPGLKPGEAITFYATAAPGVSARAPLRVRLFHIAEPAVIEPEVAANASDEFIEFAVKKLKERGVLVEVSGPSLPAVQVVLEP